MRVVFRADASSTIGTGHVMRCLTLAEGLRERGANCSFVCRRHRGHLGEVIEQRGFPLTLLPCGDPSISSGGGRHAAWLGASWEHDAAATRLVLEAADPVDWLVVDHYALDENWERALRPAARHILAIDDLADRIHDCDLLLDQNLVANLHSRYDGKVPQRCPVLLGPGFALLQPSFERSRASARPRQGRIHRLFIFFGGADLQNLTGRCLSAFLALGRDDIHADVVIDDRSSHAASLYAQVRGFANVHVHTRLPTLAPLMAAADLAVGASGAAAWERLCLGLPALVVTVADNQRPAAEELHRRGLIRLLGSEPDVTVDALHEALRDIIDSGLDPSWSSRCFAAVDGRGAARVRAALLVTATTPLKVRRARPDDEALVLEWANDPITRRNGFSPERIDPETHHRWFAARLANPEACLYVVETIDEVALGQVRFERDGDHWLTGYSVAPEFRGRGLGRVILEAAMKMLAEHDPAAVVVGRVQTGNHPSRRIFESLGFHGDAADAVIEYRRVV